MRGHQQSCCSCCIPSPACQPKLLHAAHLPTSTPQAGVTYYIVVDGYSGGDWLDSQGQYSLTITPSATDAR